MGQGIPTVWLNRVLANLKLRGLFIVLPGGGGGYISAVTSQIRVSA